MDRDDRLHPRASVSFSVDYRVVAPLEARSDFGESYRQGLAEDISVGGLCLSIDHTVPAGATVAIRFRALVRRDAGEDESSRKFELRGQARHCRPAAEKHTYRVGVQFEKLTDTERQFLSSVIQ